MTTLARRHPLTFEGEDLGTIDVAFACGANAGEYSVFYTETRRARAMSPTAPLKSVEFRLANKIVPLTLEASRPTRRSGEVVGQRHCDRRDAAEFRIEPDAFDRD